MASTTTTVRFLLSAAALLTVVLAASATSTGGSGGGGGGPSYCVSGKAIPSIALPGCRWYVAYRVCGSGLYDQGLIREACCQQLEAVPAECRCRALRVMVKETVLVIGDKDGHPCSDVPQARFAPAVVGKGECNLTTIHGGPFCSKLEDE